MGEFGGHHGSALKGILATVARTAFPPEALSKIVAPTAGSDKQILAYNLCDGETPQTAIGRKAKVDAGSLSRSIAKWIEAGVVIRVGADQFPFVPVDQAAAEIQQGSGLTR
jgi:hypothetical protein